MGVRSYKTILQDPRWQRKRLMVLQRSNWKCEWCGAGASAVALGTVLFGDPEAPVRVRSELASELAARGLDSADRIRRATHLGALPPALSSEQATQKDLQIGQNVPA